MENVEMWLTPLLFLPGVALLVMCRRDLGQALAALGQSLGPLSAAGGTALRPFWSFWPVAGRRGLRAGRPQP